MKKLLLMSLLLALVLTVVMPPLASHEASAEAVIIHEQAYVSMAQLRMQVPARWTESYETPWRTIEIDVPIHMPQVDKMPVLKISTGGTEVEADKLAAYGYIVYHDALGLQAYTSRALARAFDITPTQGRKIAGSFNDGKRPDVQPEGVALVYEDALALCQQEIERLWGLNPTHAVLKSVTVYDGVYALRRQNGQKLWGNRADERTGAWEFSFEQLYHGISMEGCDNGNAYYEANGGRLIDRRATHKGRRNVPEVITWDMLSQAE